MLVTRLWGRIIADDQTVTGQPETDPPKETGRIPRCGQRLQYGGSALVLYFLFRLLPGRKVWQALGLLPARLWILVLAGYLAAHVAGAMKYRLLLNLGGAGISRRQAARCYFAGLFASLFLPSLIGGDILRMAMALRMEAEQSGRGTGKSDGSNHRFHVAGAAGRDRSAAGPRIIG